MSFKVICFCKGLSGADFKRSNFYSGILGNVFIKWVPCVLYLRILDDFDFGVTSKFWSFLSISSELELLIEDDKSLASCSAIFMSSFYYSLSFTSYPSFSSIFLLIVPSFINWFTSSSIEAFSINAFLLDRCRFKVSSSSSNSCLSFQYSGIFFDDFLRGRG